MRLSGELTRPIFPGSPNFEDVTNGDEPEPAYILTLNDPLCTTGDEFLDAGEVLETIHLIPTEDERWFDEMNRFLGQQVTVTGKDFFGAHTGHHHARLLMTATAITKSDIGPEAETQATTVRAFYLALGMGDGQSASQYVRADKRRKGPFSPEALTAFYGKLTEPLKLASVAPIGPNRFRAQYRFKASRSSVCNGSAIVQVGRENGRNLISSIQTVTGC